MSVPSRVFLLAITGAVALAPTCPARAAEIQVQVPGVTDVGVTVDQQVSVDVKGPVDANVTVGGQGNSAPPASSPPTSSPGSSTTTAPRDGSTQATNPGNGSPQSGETPASRSPNGGSSTTTSGGTSPAPTGRVAVRDSQSTGAAASPAGTAADRSRGTGERSARPPRRSPVASIVETVPAELRGALVALALAALGFAIFSLVERRRRREAEQVALVDPLTGVANRLAFEQRLQQEWNRSARYGSAFGVLLIDIDDFKLVNDRHGHAAGDELLRSVAQRMQQRVRETDMLARFGGDEFAVICPETSLPALSTLARSLERRACELSELPGVSIGVAEYDASDDQPLDLIERADSSMYEVKRLGTKFPRMTREVPFVAS